MTVERMKMLLALFLALSFTSCAVKKKVSLSAPSETSIKTAKNGNTILYYSNLMDVSPNKLNRLLFAFIDDWNGSPHQMGGMTKRGIDCSGFVNILYKEIYGQELQRRSSDMAEHIKRKYENQLKEGDLVFFSFGGKQIDHVGVYLHNGKFLHVSTKNGVMIANLQDSWFYKYFVRAGTPQ